MSVDAVSIFSGSSNFGGSISSFKDRKLFPFRLSNEVYIF